MWGSGLHASFDWYRRVLRMKRARTGSVEDWWPIFTLVPFPFLALSTLLELIGENGFGQHFWLTVGFAAVAAIWLGGMTFLRERRWSLRTIYFLGLLVTVVGLVLWSPWFALFAWVASAHAFALFPPQWALFGASSACFLLLMAQGSHDSQSLNSLPLFFLNLLGPVIIGTWLLGRESNARRQLADELTDANDELKAAMLANAALQAELLEQARESGVYDERQRM